MTADLLAAALRYAAVGWPVFPCKPDSKEPATIHGFKDATTDPAVIEAWWRRRWRNQLAGLPPAARPAAGAAQAQPR